MGKTFVQLLPTEMSGFGKAVSSHRNPHGLNSSPRSPLESMPLSFIDPTRRQEAKPGFWDQADSELAFLCFALTLHGHPDILGVFPATLFLFSCHGFCEVARHSS